jgi:hypothetical protein
MDGSTLTYLFDDSQDRRNIFVAKYSFFDLDNSRSTNSCVTSPMSGIVVLQSYYELMIETRSIKNGSAYRFTSFFGLLRLCFFDLTPLVDLLAAFDP